MRNTHSLPAASASPTLMSPSIHQNGAPVPMQSLWSTEGIQSHETLPVQEATCRYYHSPVANDNLRKIPRPRSKIFRNQISKGSSMEKAGRRQSGRKTPRKWGSGRTGPQTGFAEETRVTGKPKSLEHFIIELHCAHQSTFTDNLESCQHSRS